MSSPELRTVRAYVNWTEQERKAAIEIYGQTGNASEVGRRLKIPVRTVQGWLSREENRQLVEDAVRRGVQHRIAEATRLAAAALDELGKRLEDPDNMPIRDLVRVYATLEDTMEVNLRRQQQQPAESSDPASFFADLELLSSLQTELARRKQVLAVEAQVVGQG
jgi:hypothetical protein